MSSTISIATNTYAPFGTVGGTPSHPEKDFTKLQQANRMPDPETKKTYRLSDGDFAYLASLADFPAIIGYDADHVPVRRRDHTGAWFTNMRRIMGVK
jgi:hypothetical protein